jgi:hypothetical protein
MPESYLSIVHDTWIYFLSLLITYYSWVMSKVEVTQ